MHGSPVKLALATMIAAGMFTRSSSAASEPIVELTWNVPAGCPDSEEALGEIRALLANYREAGARPEARVEIRRTDAGRFEVLMQTRSGELVSERRFEGATCDHVVRAATFIIALSMDPVGVAAAASSPPPLPRVEPAELSPRVIRVTPSPRLGFGIGARVAGDAGSLPLPTIGFALALEASYGRWLGEISGTLWRSRQALQGPTPGAGGEISLHTVVGRSCLALVPTLPSWYACLGMEAGLTEGRGVGILHPSNSRDLWLAMLGGIAVRQKVSPVLYLWASVDVGLPLRVPTYFIEGFGDVHHPWAVFARGALGLELQFL
jgi:hypothetical protein